ncbi:hypothetical protein PQX77_001679, partial [Marasmius sp. AFHP31]
MTEDRIQSLGHTDLLAKTIAKLFQTLQFIINCVARGVSGLAITAITELEFLTLGFAALNLVSYSFWWHKPSGVGFPVRIMDISKFISLEPPSVAQDKDEELDPAPGILSVLWDRIWDDYIGDEWDTYPFGVKMLSILLAPLRVVVQTILNAFDADSDQRPQPERGNIFSAGITDDKDPFPSTLTFSTAVILG